MDPLDNHWTKPLSFSGNKAEKVITRVRMDKEQGEILCRKEKHEVMGMRTDLR